MFSIDILFKYKIYDNKIYYVLFKLFNYLNNNNKNKNLIRIYLMESVNTKEFEVFSNKLNQKIKELLHLRIKSYHIEY